MKIKKSNLLSIPFVITMAIAFSIENNFLYCVISFLWIVYALFDYTTNRKNINKEIIVACRYQFNVFFLPALVIYLYTIFLILVQGSNYLGSLSSNLITFFPIIIGILSIYLFKTNAVRNIYFAMLLAWLVHFFYGATQVGVITVIKNAIIQGWLGTETGIENYLEIHDIVLASGYILIWYLFSKGKEKKKIFILAGMITIIFLLGVKRAGILALLICCFVYCIVHKTDENRQYHLCLFFGRLVVSFFLLYIIFIKTGILYEIVNALGINMNARNYFYDYILQFVDLSPFFMGLGRGTVTDLMALNYGYLYVHSDIIKMFAEIGMLGFIIWSSYYFIWLTKLFCRKYGNEVAVFCFMVMLYTSVLFLTDNTENYYICQLVRTTLPMAYAVSKSSNTLRCKKMSDLEKRVIK